MQEHHQRRKKGKDSSENETRVVSERQIRNAHIVQAVFSGGSLCQDCCVYCGVHGRWRRRSEASHAGRDGLTQQR